MHDDRQTPRRPGNLTLMPWAGPPTPCVLQVSVKVGRAQKGATPGRAKENILQSSRVPLKTLDQPKRVLGVQYGRTCAHVETW